MIERLGQRQSGNKLEHLQEPVYFDSYEALRNGLAQQMNVLGAEEVVVEILSATADASEEMRTMRDPSHLLTIRRGNPPEVSRADGAGEPAPLWPTQAFQSWYRGAFDAPRPPAEPAFRVTKFRAAKDNKPRETLPPHEYAEPITEAHDSEQEAGQDAAFHSFDELQKGVLDFFDEIQDPDAQGPFAIELLAFAEGHDDPVTVRLERPSARARVVRYARDDAQYSLFGPSARKDFLRRISVRDEDEITQLILRCIED